MSIAILHSAFTFVSEQDILSRFCHATKRWALIVHQKDPVLAQALKQADYYWGKILSVKPVSQINNL